MKKVQAHACHGGVQEVWQHHSHSLGCDMRFGIYLPPHAVHAQCPVLYWLSGLTCTEQNFITKAGAQRYAAEHGVIVVAPDTSPRGAAVADADGYDLGQGAGFYLNATQAPWATNYHMHEYVERYCRSWEATKVQLHVSPTNQRAMGFYLGLGYRQVAASDPALASVRQ